MQERDRTSYREQRRKEQGRAARDAKEGADDGMFFGASPQEKKERRETKDPRKIDLRSLNLNAIDREKYDAPPQVGKTVKLIDLALDPDAFKPTRATHPADVKGINPAPPQRSPQAKQPPPPRSRPPQSPTAGAQRAPARGARPTGAPPPARPSRPPQGQPPPPRPPARPAGPAPKGVQPKGVQPRPVKPPPPGQPPRPQRPAPRPSASPRPPQPGLRGSRPPQQRPGGKGR